MIVSFTILFSSSSTTISHPSCQLSIARQRKIEAIENYPRPTKEKQLNSYFDKASYHRNFIRNSSRMAAPFYALLKAIVSFELATEQESETKGEIGIKTNFAIPGYHERLNTNYRCER
jgi:hypothetical protein